MRLTRYTALQRMVASGALRRRRSRALHQPAALPGPARGHMPRFASSCRSLQIHTHQHTPPDHGTPTVCCARNLACAQAADGRARGREREGLPLPGELAPWRLQELAACMQRCCWSDALVHVVPCPIRAQLIHGLPAHNTHTAAVTSLSPIPLAAAAPPQVFEYLTTDLKRYMDRNGKGPAYPLPTQTVKVGARRPAALLAYACAAGRQRALVAGRAQDMQLVQATKQLRAAPTAIPWLHTSTFLSPTFTGPPLTPVNGVPADQGPGPLPQARCHAQGPQAAEPAGADAGRAAVFWAAGQHIEPAAQQRLRASG